MSQSHLVPKTPNRRRSTPRSKTGCITCKIRRLKCGEERPSCTRCLKSGWQCDGYEHSANLVTSSRNSSASSLSTLYPRTSSSSASRSPSPRSSSSLKTPDALFLSPQERHYFQHFINEMPVLLQAYETFFWENVALEESLTNPSVRHAIVALGALIRSTLKSKSGRYIMSLPQGLHREFALQQYQKAISGLRESIQVNPNGEELSTRKTLISCLVLAFFDNFIGNVGFALHHTTHARNILPLTALLTRTPPLFPPSPENIFLKLDCHVLFSMGISPDRTYITINPHFPSIPLPPKFTSQEQARLAKDEVIWEACSFGYQIACYQFSPISRIPPVVFQIRNYFFERIGVVQGLLDKFVAEFPPDPKEHPRERVDLYKLFTVVLQVRLATALGSSEMAMDKLLPQFRYLVESCRQILEFDVFEDPTVLANETFIFGAREISPLFLVGTKCRDPTLRREAIAMLLQSHRREWVYDSLLCGKFASWIMELEEEGERGRENGDLLDLGWELGTRKDNRMQAKGEEATWEHEGVASRMRDTDYRACGEPERKTVVSEENRCWGEYVECGLEMRRARVRCRQGIKGIEGAWRWRETEICW